MRIAVWHNLPSGGGKRALHDHVAGLISRGHYVEVWCPPTADSSYLPLSDMVVEHVLPLSCDYSEHLSERLQFTLRTGRQLRAMEEHCRACASEIMRGDFDLLFANSCRFFRTSPIGRLVEFPKVLYLQEPYRWLYEALPNNRWAAIKPGNGSFGKILKDRFSDVRGVRNARLQVQSEIDNAAAFELILCNSFFSRESILRAYGLEAQVCYLGVSSKLSGRPLRTDHSRYVVGLGSITREKRVALCIEAMARANTPDVPLVWIANFAEEGYLSELKTLARGFNVSFVPKIRISDQELTETVASATAMVYAPRLEPFGLAPIEAGHLGTPVVAVAEGGVRETVVHGVNGLLTEGSATALGAALNTVIKDVDLAAALGEGGRSRVQALWTSEAATDRLVQAFEAVLSQSAYS